MAANIHVITSEQGGWDVKRDGAIIASANFENKKDAIEYAEKEGKRYNVEVFIHGKDGKIQRREVFGTKLNPL
ncbi:MAG: DUF2188 domain-containing protein [Euryarchaeota archaeon]|jgi:hypothetical protein|uniref:DUF2188 domain-containing protein n=1 Tax=Methanobacterium sp. MZD130B TaxID=3394378 RepID=UPI00176BE9A0|nr:DUF2188 domain-containing protein [Euryarchaeota archaeon]HHT18915.1 DUF2188 domain-containing protein [Methanobacterium sp.]